MSSSESSSRSRSRSNSPIDRTKKKQKKSKRDKRDHKRDTRKDSKRSKRDRRGRRTSSSSRSRSSSRSSVSSSSPSRSRSRSKKQKRSKRHNSREKSKSRPFRKEPTTNTKEEGRKEESISKPVVPIQPPQKTEEELAKAREEEEQKKKIQMKMRLAKARALKFKNEPEKGHQLPPDMPPPPPQALTATKLSSETTSSLPQKGQSGMEIEQGPKKPGKKMLVGDDELEEFESDEEPQNTVDREDKTKAGGMDIEAGPLPPPMTLDSGKNYLMVQHGKEPQRSVNIPTSFAKANSYRSAAPPAATAVDEEDPLDAYMNQISQQAVKQETFTLVSGANGKGTFFQEVRQEPTNIDATKVITFDDILGITQANDEEIPNGANGDQNGYVKPINKVAMEEENVEEDEAAYRAFVQALKEKAKQDVKEGDEMKPEGEKDTRKIMNDEDEDDYIEFVGKPPEDDDFFSKQKKMSERRELKQIDHSTIMYPPFRKNFYIEVKEITDMTPKEVEDYRHQIGDIKVRGLNCPKPIKNWYQCGLSDKILSLLVDKRQYNEPFPIQKQALPAIMSGRDVIGIAETGSGKTLAFLLPLFRHILDQPPLEEDDGPIAVIMAPARELAWQIHIEAKAFCKVLNLRSVCVYGGAGIAGQLSDLKRGAEIVVCTPGRMIDVLTTSNGKITNLRRVTYVVIDEADRMFDLGFEPQIAKILGNIRPDRQTVMFSATFPKNVELLAKKILSSPVEIVVGSRGQICKNVEQIIEVREENSKLLRLLEILGEWNEKGSILIFVDKQNEADILFKELLKYGYFPFVLHGGQDQTDREFTITDFKKGLRNIMVATSVVARGLDIKSLVLVINFRCPDHLEDYIHRVGRTGRAGNKGTAITFITPEEDKFAGDILKALQMSNVSPPAELVKLFEGFRAKVAKGEAKKTSNRNLIGSGFKFDETEAKKLKVAKAAVKRQFGITDGEDSDDEINIITKQVSEKTDEEKKNEERKLEKRALEMIKDSNVKAQIMAGATKAAEEAIRSGASTDEVRIAALNAIKAFLATYKPTASTVEAGLEEVIKIRDEFESRADENGNIISADLEINDYPQYARTKVTKNDFLKEIEDLTSCRVIIRGVFVDKGKKPPIGQKRLYLHIEGEDKYQVTDAFKEIRRVLEESAMLTLKDKTTGKYQV